MLREKANRIIFALFFFPIDDKSDEALVPYIPVVEVMDEVIVLWLVINNQLAHIPDKGRLEDVAAEDDVFYIAVGGHVFQDADDYAVNEYGGRFCLGVIGRYIVPPGVGIQGLAAGVVPAVGLPEVPHAEIGVPLPRIGNDAAESGFKADIEGGGPLVQLVGANPQGNRKAVV